MIDPVLHVGNLNLTEAQPRLLQPNAGRIFRLASCVADEFDRAPCAVSTRCLR